jgi:aryl-phospho-beta-D-glucosidase BglC (GH1 family)
LYEEEFNVFDYGDDLPSVSLNAQLSPQDAVNAMGRGINMGNTLPPNGEGTWNNPPAEEYYFDDYKDAGFSCVRIPITWDKHTDTVPPYTIDSTWLDRVEQIVDWGLSRDLIIIINAHNDSWIKEDYTEENIARFDSIWSQIAIRFQDKSDSLIFEMINEPYPMSLYDVDELNARVLGIIRRTNPTRNVCFSGYRWSNSQELVQAAVPDDDYLIGYYHSYDPYPFGLKGPGTYGSDADIAATEAKFAQVTNWSEQNDVPVVLSEFGYIKDCEYNSRMCAYATVVEKALVNNVAFQVWDDGGNFRVYNRDERTWNEIKDILIYTYPESPNKMSIDTFADTLINIQWNNRTTENDSIIIERKVNGGNFEFFAKIAHDATEFNDTTTSTGNSYYYRLKTTIGDSIEIQSYPVMMSVDPSGLPEEESDSIPVKIKLFDNYPNPFNIYTTFTFILPSKSFVTLKVFDSLGREVETIVSEELNGGKHKRRWVVQGLSSGVYYYKIQAGNFTETKKLEILK